jgi:hypothetical protein
LKIDVKTQKDCSTLGYLLLINVTSIRNAHHIAYSKTCLLRPLPTDFVLVKIIRFIFRYHPGSYVLPKIMIKLHTP